MAETDKAQALQALKRALAAKKAGAASPGKPGKAPVGAVEKTVQRQAAAMNKPAFRRASKRG